MPGYFNLNNRVAFVTGASRGLGLTMAEALAEVGATVILNGGDANTLKVAADRMRDCGLKAETSATRQTAAPPMPATVRVRAGYALTEAMDGGLPTEELITLPTGLAKRPVYFSPACIGRSAPSPSGLLRLANGTQPWPWIDPDKALPWVEGRTGIALAESQVAAIRLALMSKVLVITGGLGVGKTTIVNAILSILAAKGVNILLCAPTGRAAKRMTEATGCHLLHLPVSFAAQDGAGPELGGLSA
jgi:exodeoxyribonuclease V alpha subunit